MYLSRIHFTYDGIRAQCRKGITANLFREHQMIWDLFENTPEQKRDFLYRREDRPGKPPFYYLLSSRQPVAENSLLTVESKTFAPQLHPGEFLQFTLRVNAVVTRKASDDSKRRIRRDIIEAKVDEYRKGDPDRKTWPAPSVIHHQAVSEWLEKQGKKYDFVLQECFVSNHSFHSVSKPSDPNKRQFASVDIQGQLKLTGTTTTPFVEVLSSGFGRSKAFGCGLMLVRRA